MKTASLEVSRKLVEAGVVLNGDFGWFNFGEGVEVFPVEGIVERYRQGSFPAPTVCELGEALPSVVNGGKLQVAKENDMWDIDYMVEVDYEESYSSLNSWLGPMEDEMADAMGLMLIFLKENGHLEDGK